MVAAPVEVAGVVVVVPVHLLPAVAPAEVLPAPQKGAQRAVDPAVVAQVEVVQEAEEVVATDPDDAACDGVAGAPLRAEGRDGVREVYAP